MKRYSVSLLLILASMTVFAEVPQSIIGTWHFDMVRTMSDHIDRLTQARPDMISVEVAETQKAGLALFAKTPKASLADVAEQSNPQVTITFTEDTISSSNVGIESTTRPYTVIGGNARLMIIESTDDEGYESVVNVRLVEGGIAIETTDCRVKPEQCTRERRQALEQMRKMHQLDRSTNTVVVESPDAFIAAGSQDEPVLDGLISPQAVDDVSQPRWVYFKKADSE